MLPNNSTVELGCKAVCTAHLKAVESKRSQRSMIKKHQSLFKQLRLSSSIKVTDCSCKPFVTLVTVRESS